jgi:hypothetical protein
MTQPMPPNAGLPWDHPAPVVVFNWADFPGEVILWIVGGHHESFATQHGVKPATRGSVIVLSGRHAGKVFEDVLMFGRIQTQVADKPPGNVSLARVKADGKTITLDTPGGYDSDVAAAWHRTNPAVLDRVRAEAVNNFHAQAVQIAARGATAAQLNAPPAQPQWTPPPAGPSSTMASLYQAAQPETQVPMPGTPTAWSNAPTEQQGQVPPPPPPGAWHPSQGAPQPAPQVPQQSDQPPF